MLEWGLPDERLTVYTNSRLLAKATYLDHAPREVENHVLKPRHVQVPAPH